MQEWVLWFDGTKSKVTQKLVDYDNFNDTLIG